MVLSLTLPTVQAGELLIQWLLQKSSREKPSLGAFFYIVAFRPKKDKKMEASLNDQIWLYASIYH